MVSDQFFAAMIQLSLFIILVFVFLRVKRAIDNRYAAAHKADKLLKYKRYNVEVFVFSSDIENLDDIVAKRLKNYRDTGGIADYGFDGGAIYNEELPSDSAHIFEMGEILSCAAEKKRAESGEDSVIYFISSLRPAKLKTPTVSNLYGLLIRQLQEDKKLLVRITKENHPEASD